MLKALLNQLLRTMGIEDLDWYVRVPEPLGYRCTDIAFFYDYVSVGR